jgi:hypothetical protein
MQAAPILGADGAAATLPGAQPRRPAHDLLGRALPLPYPPGGAA